MEAAFIKALNLSISAGWLVLAVILLRLLLKKAPKTVSVILWALVAFRLVCPFSFESVLSLIPSAETVPEEILYSDAPAIQSGIPALNSAVNPVISENFSPGVAESVNPLQIITFAAAAVWLAGAALMLIYAAVSCLKIKKKILVYSSCFDDFFLFYRHIQKYPRFLFKLLGCFYLAFYDGELPIYIVEQLGEGGIARCFKSLARDFHYFVGLVNFAFF